MNTASTSSSPRAGSAIFLAMLLIGVLAGIVLLAVDQAVSVDRDISRLNDGGSAAAAVEAVLLRREHDVARLATLGDAANFSKWSIETSGADTANSLGMTNYGLDTINGFDVRWKIEPARTAPVSDPLGETAIPFLANPSPDPSFVIPSTSTQVPNDALYLYRVAAEARRSSGNDETRLAQGVRYVSLNREPLFRYVLFYAQRGAKGDLELSHADSVNIQGSVHTNGSLYVGGGLKVNDAIAQRGSIDGLMAPSKTILGPDIENRPISVNGLDGIFRLSKPLMFSIINGFPLSTTTVVAAGAPSGSWDAGSSYDTSSTVFPLEDTPPAGGTPLTMTSNGTWINPYRIKDGSGAVTQGIADVRPTDSSARVINGVTLLGGTAGNDSRDHQRSSAGTIADRTWTKKASADFDNLARSKINGASFKAVQGNMNRGLEAQALTYVDVDGNSTTDHHEYARPQFLATSTGNITLNPFVDSPGTTPLTEAPGYYVGLALGSGSVAMTRIPEGHGWSIRPKGDPTGTPVEGLQSGLLIRERPIPDTDYWPGSSAVSVVDPANPRYLPYAYGKHWYPTIAPFTSTDVSDNLHRTWKWDNGNPMVSQNISMVGAHRVASYNGGGAMTITAAANPGPSHSNNGSWSSYAGSALNGIQRKLYFYRDAWRFVHLGKYVPDTTRNGLQLSYYRDQAAVSTTENTYYDENRGRHDPLPFASGMATSEIALVTPADRVVSTTNGVLSWASNPATPSTTHWSARWVGFYKPTSSGFHVFSGTAGNSNQSIRLWVDGQRVWEVNMAANATTPNALNLTAGRYYSFVCELASSATGAPSTAPTIRANLLGSAAAVIPATSFHPPASTGTPGMIPTASFTALQCRIDNPQALTTPAAAKIGLMIRPEQTISPLQQGGSAYAMVGWSPSRGFFTQRRGEPTKQSQRTIGLYYIGNGTGPSGSVNALGEIPEDPSAVTGVTRSAYFREVWRSPVVASVTAYPTGSTLGAATVTTQPVAYTGPMAKDVGGGKIWQILTPFSIGTYTASRTVTPTKNRRITKSLTQTLQLYNDVGGTAPLVTADDNRTITFFTNTTGTGGFGNGGTVGTNARTWWFSTPAGVYDSTARRNLSRTWSNQWNSAAVNGTVVTQPLSIGGATTAWAAGNIQISKIGVISNATPGDLTTVTGMSITAIQTSMTPSFPNPTIPAGNYPADGATPLPTTPTTQPADPALPDFTNGTAGRSFSILRSNTSIWFDLHPWITTDMAWRTVADPTYLPRAANWPSAWTSGVATWPLTMAHRPDLWKSTSNLAYGTNPTLTSGALRGVTGTNATGAVTSANGYEMTDDYRPSGFNASTTTEVWLRIEKSGSTLTFRCLNGTTPPTGPTDSRWYTLPGTLDISSWGTSLLLGPCVQSGSLTTPITASFSNLKVETTLAAPYDVIDQTDWDSSSGTGTADDLSKYLISQYQVFYGTREITEDFLTWRDSNGRRLVNEDWFFQPREFWSQRRTWDHTNAAGAALEKDPFTAPSTTFTSTTNRRLLAKTTVLSLDMQMIQQYLTNRTFAEATADRIVGIGPSALSNSNPTAKLVSSFNGVIYAARTNRYPWNPHAAPHLLGATPAISGINPYSPNSGLQYPNTIPTILAGTNPQVVNGGRLSTWDDAELSTVDGVHKLEPYGLAQAPAFKPQQFHHGVRIVNARNISIKYPAGATSTGTNVEGGTDWSFGDPPRFGTSRLSVVTPNQLYVQGSLNVDRYLVKASGVTTPQYKYTPMAIMGDQVTLLSNAWTDTAYQVDDVTVTNTSPGITGSGSLVCANLGAAATQTSYHAGIVTNNLPTTRARVMEGQAAPFVDTTLFLENWNGVEMHYLGSLVVLDSRRYSESFLLGSLKTYGTSPFGIVACSDPATPANSTWLPFFGVTTADWVGRSPAVYSEPIRRYAFNFDFMVSDGTPPFVPFGVSSGGIGGWVRNL